MSKQLTVEVIASRIFFIRGVKVMLDRDLAELYGVETKVLKQAVKRNIKRFPDDFMFELTKDEDKSLRSQIVTLKRGQHSKYAPFAFTELGIAMLSTVLKSEKAIEINIQIMRIFTRLRQLIIDNADLRRDLEDLRQISDERFQIVFETLDQILKVEYKPKKNVGFIVKEKTSKYCAKK